MSDIILNPIILNMLKLIEQVLAKHNVQYYLVGAVARDVHLSKHNLAAKRKTEDVDIAIMLENEEQFYAIKDALLETGDFSAHATEAIKLFYKESIELDLLPFGRIENEYAETQLHKPRLFVIDVPAFKEILPHVEALDIDGILLNVCPIEGIIVLKLLANNDRPERTKDIADIEHFISTYFDMFRNEIYENHYDEINLVDKTTDNEVFEKLVSSRIIGWKIENILKGQEALLGRIKLILEQRTNIYWQEMLEGINDR